MKWTRASLGELTGGSSRRAAGVLVATHLAPAPVMLGIWAVGLLPVFDDLRWIPAVLSVVVGLVMVLALFLRFGFWGTPSTGMSDQGEEYMASFSPVAGFGLGWLRWFMQIVAVFIVVMGCLFIYGDARAWHVFGTDELRSLAERADAIPVPEDWRLVDTEASGFGITGISGWPAARDPEGFVKRTFEVPSTYTFDDLKQWVESPDWADDPDGNAFGAVEVEGCDTDQASCEVHLVPPAGEQPEHFVSARLREPTRYADHGEVEVRLTYRKYVEPDWGVSRETVDRAMAIPIPVGWVRSDVSAGTSNNGETFTRYFGVPASTTRADLEAWLRGPTWTAPPSGEPFGAIEVGECREVGSGETNRTYLCSTLVVRDDPDARPVESLRASLDADHRVRVTLERNG